MKPMNSREAIEYAEKLSQEIICGKMEDITCDKTGYPIFLMGGSDEAMYDATNQRELHHTALGRGYITKKIKAIILPYEGRFGNGEILITNYSSRHVLLAYYTD